MVLIIKENELEEGDLKVKSMGKMRKTKERWKSEEQNPHPYFVFSKYISF